MMTCVWQRVSNMQILGLFKDAIGKYEAENFVVLTITHC